MPLVISIQQGPRLIPSRISIAILVDNVLIEQFVSFSVLLNTITLQSD